MKASGTRRSSDSAKRSSDSAKSRVEEYEREFVARTRRSRSHFERARLRLPGGITGHNKFMVPHPLYVRCAQGAHFTDVDGNSYVDLLMGAGPLLLGHAPKAVTSAIQRQAELGTLFVLPTEHEFELASRIQKHMPHIERIRFSNSGSEATIMALRVARAYTSRNKVAKFEGHFHGGAHDNLMINSFMPGARRGEELVPRPDWAGIPAYVSENVVLLPFNELDHTLRLIRSHARDLAAVILEPVPFTTLGGITPEAGFLEEVRRVTEKEGILLIFDEIITGFRLGFGGAAAYFGVEPDLTTLGKIIGGGLPLGAYGGRQEIMEKVVTPTGASSDAQGKIFQSGTFTGYPIGLVAGIAVLDELERRDVYGDLGENTEGLRQRLKDACWAAGIPAQVTGIESMFHLQFTRHPIRTHTDVMTANPEQNREFCLGLIVRGVFWPLRHGGFLSTAHTKADINRVIEASNEVLCAMGEKGARTTRPADPHRKR